MRSVVPFLFVASIAACTPELPEGVFVCATTADCPPSMSCDTGLARCVSGVVETDASACTADQVQSVDGCVDRNECATPNVCGAGQESCTNLAPGYECTCAAGFSAAPDGRSCVNVDECMRGSDDCDWISTCSDTSGSFTCACAIGFAPNANGNCVPTCVPGSDGDSGMRMFTAGHGSITGMGGAYYGFDIDGLNNTFVGSGGTGKTIAGCSELDAANGVDNALGNVANSLDSLVSLNAVYDDALVGGDLDVSFAVARLASGASATDACVGVTMTIDGASYMGAGALEDHVLHVMFVGTFPLPVPLVLPPEMCDGNVCNPASLAIPLRGVRASLLFDSTNTTILDATIGGFAFFEDTSSLGYDNAAGFKNVLIEYASTSGLVAAFRDTMIAGFGGARDLRMHTDGSLEDCTAPGGNANQVTRNSFSVALHLSP